MALAEAGAWLDGDLELKIAGKRYAIPEPSAELGVRIEVLLNTGLRETDRYKNVLSDQEERDLYSDLLGDAYQQMADDGVSYPMVKLAAVTAMYHFVISPEVAEAYWNGAVTKGKAPAARGSSGSSRPATRATTAAASTTKRRASGSGTRSRPSS